MTMLFTMSSHFIISGYVYIGGCLLFTMGTLRWWGKSCNINLYGCNPALLRNPKDLCRFVSALCSLLKMKLVGRAHVKRFGKGYRGGHSVMQFIETSTIVIHCDEKEQRAFIDIFTCKRFDHRKAVRFCKNWFRAARADYQIMQRQ